MGFVHLQCHSHYSLLDGAIRIPDLIERTVALNQTAVALTDNGVMFGAIEFYLAAKSKGIKPIIGCELMIARDRTVKERGYARLILLATSFLGYQNLIRIVTDANLNGFYYVPRTDFSQLALYAKDIIAISPGNRGVVGYYIQSHQGELAHEFAIQLSQLFSDAFYLGIQRLGFPNEAVVNAETIALGSSLNIPVVATNDVYYRDATDSHLRHILNCIKQGKKIDDDTRSQNDAAQFFRSEAEMMAVFSDCPEVVSTTQVIADRCNIVIETEQVHLPQFAIPSNETPDSYLKTLVMNGISTRYPTDPHAVLDRVQFELDIICKMQYAPYFLIIHDFLAYCRQEKIPVGPGRGSAAGSIVAYALGITAVDPIRYNLLFERFLNPERVSMPDIDLDFCIRRRNEVIEYIINRYGADHVSQIVTFGSMNARAVIRDVGRVLNLPLADVDLIAKLIPAQAGSPMTIPQSLEMVADLKQRAESNPQIAQLLAYGAKLEGFARHTSTHAAGIVISKDPLISVVPLTKNEGQITTQYPMSDLEKIGLLKMDILGLRNLTVIDDCLQLIRKKGGQIINLDEIPIDDEKTYATLSNGETMGIFQCESRGMRTLIRDLKPTCFEDIIALLALYRPGPLGSGMVNDFISNKSGKTKVRYDLPELLPILQETYGMIVYQEQVMQIASVVGGFTLGQADMMRRAMGKKKKDEMDRLREMFLSGAEAKSIDAGTAGRIFDLCYKFAEYGFNKSHSAAYAVISYQTAYLKTHFTIAYMTALLSSVLGVTDKVAAYIRECQRLGIGVLPPEINESESDFSICDAGIRFGLKAIKNVGEGAIQSIIECRNSGPYQSVFDFCARVDLRQVNKRVVECLIKVGAFDAFGDRGWLIEIWEHTFQSASVYQKERSNGQLGLFGEINVQPSELSEKKIAPPPIPTADKLAMEREMVGLYLSGHPLDPIRNLLKDMPYNSENITPEIEGKTITVAGILTECRRIMSRSKREMLVGIVEDLTGQIPVIAFHSDRLNQIASFFVDDNPVYLTGRVRVNQDEISLMCEEIKPIDMDNLIMPLHIDIDGLEEPTILSQICNTIVQFSGNHPVWIHTNGQIIETHPRFWVTPTTGVQDTLGKIIGSGRIWTE